jgi:hypothetical protein
MAAVFISSPRRASHRATLVAVTGNGRQLEGSLASLRLGTPFLSTSNGAVTHVSVSKEQVIVLSVVQLRLSKAETARR